MPAIAMTDHGNVFGAYDFYKQAKAAGVKPIIGIEAYLTPNTSRFERKGVSWDDGGDDDVSGARRLHPHDAARRRPPRACTTCSGSPPAPGCEGFFNQPRDRPRAARRSTPRA